MTFLVTGADGQLGQCLGEIAGHRSGERYRFLGRTEWDISDETRYEEFFIPEVSGVINTAAYTSVDRAETDRDQAYRINVEAVGLLARWCGRFDIPLIHFSTDYVYAPGEKPLRETDPTGPLNWYGTTKWIGEETVRQAGCKHLIFRTSWLYSHYGHNFVRTMLRLGQEREEIRVVADQVGSPTWAMDLAEAVDRILHEKNLAGSVPWGTYNFANKGRATWFELAEKVLAGRTEARLIPVSSEEYPTAAERSPYSVLDTSLFSQVFDYSLPKWEDSLERCLQKLEDNTSIIP